MNVNCVSNDFWQKPFSIDFADRKFGYCVLAVFTKKGVFQRTYMIPPSIRARVIKRKSAYRGSEFHDNNEKAYNMCVNGACSFDNERAIMAYYNKTDEMFSKRRVYAIYFNLYKTVYSGNFQDSINYMHQTHGEEASLSTEDIDNIWSDLARRVYLPDLMNYTDAVSVNGPTPNLDSHSSMLHNIYSLFDIYDNGVQNTVLVKNKQILCDIYGVKAGEFDFPYLTVFTKNVLVIASKTGLIDEWDRPGLKEYTELLVSHYILNAKCFYHYFMDAVLLKSDDGTLKSALHNLLRAFGERKVSVKFHNERKVCESFVSGLKLSAVIRAADHILNHYVSVYNCVMMQAPYFLHPRRTSFSFTTMKEIATGYFVPELKEKAISQILDFIEPPMSRREFQLRHDVFPVGTALPLMNRLTPQDKNSAECTNLSEILPRLGIIFCAAKPLFPVYDGRTCAFIAFGGINDMKISEIYMVGGE